MYSTKEVLSILKVSRPTLYKMVKETNLQPKKTSEKGKYLFNETDIILLKIYLKTNKISRKMFLYDLYDDVLKILLLYSKQYDPSNGEKLFNEFFKSYKKGIVLNMGKLN